MTQIIDGKSNEIVGGADVLIGPADADADPQGLTACIETPKALFSVILPLVNENPHEDWLNVCWIEVGMLD